MITMSDSLARAALKAAPPFPPHQLWTPLAYTDSSRGAAAGNIANAIRNGAHYLTLEERSRLAMELLTPHSVDHARDHRFEEHTG
jgi:hypothetical protein